jgi:thymidine kinase
MSLDIVIGPMFSGKSSHAMSYVRRQKAIGKKVIVIKPNIDRRYSQDDVMVTHDREQTPCMIWDVDRNLAPTHDITKHQCIVVEEAQFFHGLRDFVIFILKAHRRDILLVGLDGDARQESFGEVLNCIPFATNVTKLHAYCMLCKDGTIAPFTRKNDNSGPQVDVGGSDKYLPVCLRHLN